MPKYIGILTAGGDSPGLNAAIRGVGKAAIDAYDINIVGFQDGFRGLMENRSVLLHHSVLSGILTIGGTILGTSRDKPHKMTVGNKIMDMTDAIVENYHKNHLDALVCLGGGGTQKNAFRLMQHGLNVITLPKTIDNDVAMTDRTFGFDTALGIATEAIDRLHSTAHSHHRILVVEIMGHNAGWLALGSGIAGGADVILIPEIPYDINKVADAIRGRSKSGKHFSIVAVSEGAISTSMAKTLSNLEEEKKKAKDGVDKKKFTNELQKFEKKRSNHAMFIAEKLQQLCNIETRVTILGHLQRGGTPSAADRILATKLGTACATFISKEHYGIMVADHEDRVRAVPLKDVVGKRKVVPLGHAWIKSARLVGTCLGDQYAQEEMLFDKYSFGIPLCVSVLKQQLLNSGFLLMTKKTRNKKFYKHTVTLLIFTLLLFITGCYFSAGTSKLDYMYNQFGLGFPMHTKAYLAHNIWFKDPMKISFFNYQQGKIIPFGTEITFVEAYPDYVVFKTVNDKTEYKITNDPDLSLLSNAELFNQIFTPINPDTNTANKSEEIITKLKKGEIEVGMSRKEVLLALGPPPLNMTPRGTIATWIYFLNNTLKTTHVVFKHDKVSHIFTN